MYNNTRKFYLVWHNLTGRCRSHMRSTAIFCLRKEKEISRTKEGVWLDVGERRYPTYLIGCREGEGGKEQQEGVAQPQWLGNCTYTHSHSRSAFGGGMAFALHHRWSFSKAPLVGLGIVLILFFVVQQLLLYGLDLDLQFSCCRSQLVRRNKESVVFFAGKIVRFTLL